MSCAGLRDSTADTVRPLPMCQTCQHWLHQTGPQVMPAAVCRVADAGMVLLCTRRVAVAAEPEAD